MTPRKIITLHTEHQKYNGRYKEPQDVDDIIPGRAVNMAGKSTIGAGLAIDGEKEFRNAVTGINREMSVLASEMKKVTAQYDDNADSLDGLNANEDVFQRKAETQKKN